MIQPADARLQRLLGGDHLAPLRQRLRRRFERAPLDAPLDLIRVSGLTEEEHATLASLVGRPQRHAGSLSIDVGLVDSALRQAGIAVSLRDALELLDGPIAHLATTRARLAESWSTVVAGCTHPDLADMLREAAALGLLKRLAGQAPQTAAALCCRAESVLRQLPSNGVTRAQLAADALGDAHALDGGQPVATLVLAVWRRRATRLTVNADVSMEPVGDDDPQAAAERTRDIWAAAGVLVNELARPALFLNLPAKNAEARDRGQPGYVSLRSLLRAPPAWEVVGRRVHVCENPNLVAIAADRLGAACMPLVCTEGMPAAAQRTLLHQLTQAGAHLHYHGDFDWPGIHIANHMIRRHGAQPWRMGAADYRTAIQRTPGNPSLLEKRPVPALWDGALTSAMTQHQIAVAEEALADDLVEDLSGR
jgi:uncharacterized protein (TIGR02679 family)